MTEEQKTRLILVTNDDGYEAEGVVVLYNRLRDLGETYLVAPDREKSATSLALTLREPLRARRVGPTVFAVEGTPADCLYLAVEKLLPRRPDLVVSGINHGPNLGQQDVSYSGTVAGAVQGTYFGIPSLAVSALSDSRGIYPFELAADISRQISALLLAGPPVQGITLNLNVPPPPFQGLRLTKLGEKRYAPEIIQADDPRRRSYYWIGLGNPSPVGDGESDLEAIRRGYASLTPLHSDLTDYTALRDAALQGLASRIAGPAKTKKD